MSNEYINTAAKSKTSFLYSFSLLPKEKRDAIKTVYAFCRKTDDIVDDTELSVISRNEKIKAWRKKLIQAFDNNSDDELLIELINIIHKYNIPEKPFFDLIDGMEQDLNVFRYRDFESLYEYCYKAASTVGLMSVEIFGYKTEKAHEFAVALGIAMQLTNIIRDIKQDAINGRIYIPTDDLAKYDYSENDLIKNIYNANFIELMKFECERAKFYYRQSDELLSEKDRKLLFPALIMKHIYYNILQNVEKQNYNVFARRAKVSDIKKVYLTLSIYLKTNIRF